MSSQNATGCGAMEHGPFSRTAHDLRLHGLAVLPVGGATGKQPLITWARWKKAPGKEFVDKLTWRHSHANIGIICHLSGVTVVDIDDPSLLAAMLGRFGDTPLITRTPSGGFHLWYSYAGEQSTNLRGEGLAVDIKGRGGFVVVPPSVATQGPHAGTLYAFERGSWHDLERLPEMRKHSLPRLKGERGNGRVASTNPTPTGLRSIGVGRRNDMLFRLLLRQAPYCDSLDALLDVAFTVDDSSLEEPLPPAEVAKTASSAWDYERRGENWVGREAKAVVNRSTFETFQQNPDAYVLWTKLVMEHGARKEAFAMPPAAMAKNEVIAGWRDKRRYRKARDWLVEEGFLEQLHTGGRAAGDPHLFRLSTPSTVVESRGARNAPNITKHLPPSRIGRDAGTPEDMSDPLALGRKLRQRRQEAGLSQTEVARRAGVSRATIGNLETGRLQPSTTTMQRLAAVFHERQERGAA